MKKVLVTYEIPENGLEILRKHFEVDINKTDKPLNKEYFKKNISNYFGVLTMLYDPIDKEVLNRAKDNVKIISNYAVGYNNINIDIARDYGITVCNTPGVLTNATSEIAFGLMISIMRRIVEGDKYVRKNNFNGWRPKLLIGEELKNKTVGIFGMGRIGKAFAKKCNGFDMNIIYHDRNQLNPEEEKKYNAKFVSFLELIKKSDIISIHAPLTEETKHSFTEDTFDKMKNGTYIINTGRGAVIKESDLVKALKEKKIKAAGLDVYEHEPEIHNELIDMENVVLLPHIGSASKYAREEMSRMAAQAIVDVYKGIAPENKIV
ncbi:MAG: D-glycerate dehydrogenase [Candidatus Mcinerneyibacterium aminivorans]|uniref:D-glycerate dehydrogenase n=1 Tax=Candidatus Mcinerneyibacterium aminivorans TaxID=2703815 RepID=A0A5D0MHS3_9BACT|nr:MAG: D-glycerate dehydrogenase [Candidatus Mcinerneyibacterium aminivorans]